MPLGVYDPAQYFLADRCIHEPARTLNVTACGQPLDFSQKNHANFRLIQIEGHAHASTGKAEKFL